jgi:excisionase family DNA binding protein
MDSQLTYLTPEQFGEHRQVSRGTVYSWIARGLPSVKQGRTRRIKKIDGDAWLDAGCAVIKSKE